MEIIQILQDYGPYIGLPVLIHYITQGLKTKIPFFGTVNGLRIVHFLPVVLGMLGGLLLLEETWQDKILTGGALGCLNLLIYKTITVSLAKTSDLKERVDAKAGSKSKKSDKED